MQWLRHYASYEKRGGLSTEALKSYREDRRYHFDFLNQVLVVTMHTDYETRQGNVTSPMAQVELAIKFSRSSGIWSIKILSQILHPMV